MQLLLIYNFMPSPKWRCSRPTTLPCCCDDCMLVSPISTTPSQLPWFSWLPLTCWGQLPFVVAVYTSRTRCSLDSLVPLSTQDKYADNRSSMAADDSATLQPEDSQVSLLYGNKAPAQTWQHQHQHSPTSLVSYLLPSPLLRQRNRLLPAARQRYPKFPMAVAYLVFIVASCATTVHSSWLAPLACLSWSLCSLATATIAATFSMAAYRLCYATVDRCSMSYSTVRLLFSSNCQFPSKSFEVQLPSPSLILDRTISTVHSVINE